MKVASKLLIGVALVSLAASTAWGLEGAYINAAGWVFEFKSDGVLLVWLEDPGQAGLLSPRSALSYELNGNRITITSSPDLCEGETGVYTFEETEEGVSFALVSDLCSDRVAELSRPFLKKAPEV